MNPAIGLALSGAFLSLLCRSLFFFCWCFDRLFLPLAYQQGTDSCSIVSTPILPSSSAYSPSSRRINCGFRSNMNCHSRRESIAVERHSLHQTQPMVS